MSARRGPPAVVVAFLTIVLVILAAIVLGIVFALGCSVCRAHAHESPISGLRSKSGEWCCGEGDCFVIPAIYVSARADGYHVIFTKWGPAPAPDGIDKRVSPFDPDLRFETVPYSEAQPWPDGQYWRCKRPDGSRRCFFAPPPNT